MKIIVCLVAFAIVAVTANNRVFGPTLRMQNLYKGPPAPALQQTDRRFPDQWIDQRIDNFDAQNSETYRMVILSLFKNVFEVVIFFDVALP